MRSERALLYRDDRSVCLYSLHWTNDTLNPVPLVSIVVLTIIAVVLVLKRRNKNKGKVTTATKDAEENKQRYGHERRGYEQAENDRLRNLNALVFGVAQPPPAKLG